MLNPAPAAVKLATFVIISRREILSFIEPLLCAMIPYSKLVKNCALSRWRSWAQLPRRGVNNSTRVSPPGEFYPFLADGFDDGEEVLPVSERFLGKMRYSGRALRQVGVSTCLIEEKRRPLVAQGLHGQSAKDLGQSKFLAASSDAEDTYQAIKHVDMVPNLSPQNMACIEIGKDFMLSHGYIKKDFDVQKWAASEFLEEAAKQLVQERWEKVSKEKISGPSGRLG